jgi:hypothetical protein
LRASRHTRKRYLLLSGERQVDPETQKEFTRLVLEKYPDLGRNRVIWFRGSLIVRTDQVRLAEMEQALAMKVGETRLTPRRVSGSISKLKREAQG